MGDIRRGQVYFIYLDPCFGRELGGYKVRPVVVVSVNEINENARVISVVPGSTNDRFVRLNIVEVAPDRANNLPEKTYFQCHQIRSVDPGRMTSRPKGQLSRADFEKIEAALRLTLGLP
jgi:mRNA-degrading endonuclease toxin of MazEF toxin-antitoxin module